ncbi:MAG: acyl-CoA dehydrogenase family protein [Acidimicrobiales bacterium]
MPGSIAEVKQAVDSVLGLVGQRSDDIERARRLPDEVVVALRRTGVNRLTLPEALGGLEAPVIDMIDVFERIAAVDGSAAWCTTIGVGSNFFGGYMTEAGARIVFSDADQGSATMFEPSGKVVRDGDRCLLRGRWPFASNVLHSVWIGVGALVEGDDGTVDPVPRVVFVPVADLVVEDTWDALGLRGTGSHHVAVSDLAVDLDRSCTFADQPWPEGTLWRLPVYAALFPLLAAVPLGIARGALDEIARQARVGRVARRGQLDDDPVALAELAGADTRLRAARAVLREVVEEAHLLAERGDPIDRHLQARTYLACLLASDVATEVTTVAHNLGGGAAAYTDSPLQRALRDVETSRQHLLFAHRHRVAFGKALAGIDVAYRPFFL